MISTCEQGFLRIYIDNWRNELNREHARRESEQHVLLYCPLFKDLHHELFNQAFELNSEFYSLNDDKKLIFLFTTSNMIKTVAKTCKDSLDRRRRFLYE